MNSKESESLATFEDRPFDYVYLGWHLGCLDNGGCYDFPGIGPDPAFEKLDGIGLRLTMRRAHEADCIDKGYRILELAREELLLRSLDCPVTSDGNRDPEPMDRTPSDFLQLGYAIGSLGFYTVTAPHNMTPMLQELSRLRLIAAMFRLDVGGSLESGQILEDNYTNFCKDYSNALTESGQIVMAVNTELIDRGLSVSPSERQVVLDNLADEFDAMPRQPYLKLPNRARRDLKDVQKVLRTGTFSAAAMYLPRAVEAAYRELHRKVLGFDHTVETNWGVLQDDLFKTSQRGDRLWWKLLKLKEYKNDFRNPNMHPGDEFVLSELPRIVYRTIGALELIGTELIEIDRTFVGRR